MTQKRKSYGKGSKNCKPAKKKCVRRSHEFTGNQYTADMQTDFTSSSAKKLSSNREFDVKVDETFSYCILTFNLVFSALAELLKCKICNSDVKFTQTNAMKLTDGLSVTEIAVQISLATFNEGRITLLKMMKIMGCTIGRYAYDYALRKDDERIAIAEKATKAATKEGRIKHKERQQDEQMEYERSGLLLYGAGIAD
ncbi:hypothetical protein TKK_0003104 [Trichogramma kaykai]